MGADSMSIVFDYASVRRNDVDGHLFVGSSVISAAQVNPYNGQEIPGYARLGLDPDRKYMLLRDPGALEAALPSLHGKPLLIRHRAQTSGDYDPGVTIGTVMNPKWVPPNIEAELEVWHPDGVKAIQSGQKTDLSAGYRYTPVMEPGTYNGVPYDGRMTEIQFNHVALVDNGRVKGAMVGDQKPEEFFEMDKTTFYRALIASEDRAFKRMKDLREAERVCGPRIAHLGRMALDADSPEAYYRLMLLEMGVTEDLTEFSLADLKSLYRIKSRGGNYLDQTVTRETPSSARGATSPQSTIGAGTFGGSTLDAILAGTSAPQKTAGMAGDSRPGASPLDAILKGVSRPVDMSRPRA